MGKKKIAILGGGLTGLSAGIYLARNGFEPHIFEKEDQMGGLVGGKIINQNIYEYGPHFFHSNNPLIINEVKNAVGEDLIDFERTILIKFMNDYFTYPLSVFEVFKKLPKSLVMKAVFELIVSNIRGFFKREKNPNSETLLLNFYGNTLYELFFKDYIYRVWGITPDKFSPKFAQERIPKISASIFLNKFISPLRAKFSKKKVKDFVENVDGKLFTTKLGYRGINEKLIEQYLRNGGYIHLNSEVKSVFVNDNTVHKITFKENTSDSETDSEKEFYCDAVINTIPITNLVSMINPKVPKDVQEASNFLEYRALVFVGILVKKEKVLPVSFMYFREHSFNRVYDSSYFGHDTSLSNTTIIVCEISSSGNDRWWIDDDYCIKKAKYDLKREKIIDEKDILEAHVYRYRYGYPVYKFGFENNLETIMNYLSNISNFETAGRQGAYQYINGHIAIQMGFDAAKKIKNNLLK